MGVYWAAIKLSDNSTPSPYKHPNPEGCNCWNLGSLHSPLLVPADWTVGFNLVTNSIPALQSRQPSTVWLLLYYLLTVCLQQLCRGPKDSVSDVPGCPMSPGQVLGSPLWQHCEGLTPTRGFQTRHSSSAAAFGSHRWGGSRPQGLKRALSQLCPTALPPSLPKALGLFRFSCYPIPRSTIRHVVGALLTPPGSEARSLPWGDWWQAGGGGQHGVVPLLLLLLISHPIALPWASPPARDPSESPLSP